MIFLVHTKFRTMIPINYTTGLTISYFDTTDLKVNTMIENSWMLHFTLENFWSPEHTQANWAYLDKVGNAHRGSTPSESKRVALCLDRKWIKLPQWSCVFMSQLMLFQMTFPSKSFFTLVTCESLDAFMNQLMFV